MKTYKDLIVWQKAMILAEKIYQITSQLPKTETYVLASQMQRASISVASNIAEGSKRNHKLEYIQFLSIANGSAAELETQLLLTKRLYKDSKIDFDNALSLVEEILKMLYALVHSLKLPVH
jgi:four helix bundle protein